MGDDDELQDELDEIHRLLSELEAMLDDHQRRISKLEHEAAAGRLGG